MLNYGIKVAKNEKDATSNDPRDFLIWSEYPNYEVVAEGSGMLSIVPMDFQASLTITHNLGYTPQIICYVSDEIFPDPVDTGIRFKVTGINMSITEGGYSYSAALTAEDLNTWRINTYRVNSDPGSTAYYFYKYYIFKNGF